VQEGEYGGNICTNYEKGKLRPVETILRGWEGIKKNDGGGGFN
jgi:hypothetical protein